MQISILSIVYTMFITVQHCIVPQEHVHEHIIDKTCHLRQSQTVPDRCHITKETFNSVLIQLNFSDIDREVKQAPQTGNMVIKLTPLNRNKIAASSSVSQLRIISSRATHNVQWQCYHGEPSGRQRPQTESFK